MSVLRTVCVAGGARGGFNCDANARLDLLVEAGLLTVAEHPEPETGKVARRRFYRPTSKGVTMAQAVKTHGAA
jgi:hypothetical protein